MPLTGFQPAGLHPGDRLQGRSIHPDRLGTRLRVALRRGKVRPEEIARLDLSRPFDLDHAKRTWRSALDDAERFIEERPAEEVGCLYWSAEHERFEAPGPGASLEEQGLIAHYGRMGGVLPRPTGQRFEP